MNLQSCDIVDRYNVSQDGLPMPHGSMSTALTIIASSDVQSLLAIEMGGC